MAGLAVLARGADNRHGLGFEKSLKAHLCRESFPTISRTTNIEIRISKSETNSKRANSNVQNSHGRQATNYTKLLFVGYFEFRASNLFRISCFEIRISCGPVYSPW
jgi:hypothetical protein